MNGYGFKLYLLFAASWYLHLPERIKVLGSIRFDLLLFAVLVVLAVAELFTRSRVDGSPIEKRIKWLVLYILVTIPFVEWPGTVVKVGLVQFLKASSFFFFTTVFISNEKRLKIFLGIYLFCQIFRVLEPLYLHVTQGYWGGMASMLGGQEFMTRLSGSPHDMVGANGLAFIVVTIIPFLYYFSSISWKLKALFWVLLPPLLYALVLTASRSGLIGLSIFVFYVIYKSNKKYLLAPAVLIVSIFTFLNLSSDMQDRYLSIFSSETKNAATVEDRIAIPIQMAKLILHKPLVGYGLGTSLEANANYGTFHILPHNLYVELGIEIGLIGMVIFLLYLKSIVSELKRTYSSLKSKFADSLFLLKCSESLVILLIMNLVFTLASYGLLVPVWYFFGGLIVVLNRMTVEQTATQKSYP